MPRRDGTGPNGEGSMTGWKMGNCQSPKVANHSFCRGNRRRNGFNFSENGRQSNEYYLDNKEAVSTRIENIEKELSFLQKLLKVMEN